MVGPTFKNLYGHTVTLEGGSSLTADENYIRRSILEPKAEIVSGFQPVMPTYQGLLNDRDIDALVAYIKSLKDQKDE
jgi:cytochrome c oxidase subunit 2